MSAFIDITGFCFGRWTVMEYSGRRHWLCRCVCGNEAEVYRGSLQSGVSQSCGCLTREATIKRNTKHGEAARGRLTSEYRCWLAIHSRCANPKVPCYSYYGGRGIKVCQRWRSFKNFVADMGRRPTAQHSIDRIDFDGDYEPSNCRWATKEQQANNRRGVK